MRRRQRSTTRTIPDMIALRQQIDAMRNGDATSGTGSDLEAQLAAQRASLAEMRQRYSEDYPGHQASRALDPGAEARVASGEKDSTTYVSRTPAVVQLETQLNGVETQIAALERQRASCVQGSQSAKPPAVYAGG